jgi:hypothetical protein
VIRTLILAPLLIAAALVGLLLWPIALYHVARRALRRVDHDTELAHWRAG